MSMFSPRSIVEDNQATIRILENGKSPTFRHTDETQRVNLAWLAGTVLRGDGTQLVHGPQHGTHILTISPLSMLRSGNLQSICSQSIRPIQNTPKKALANVAGVPLSPANAVPSTRGPVASKSDAKRSIVEFCCHPESKLSQTNRKWSDGCEVLQFTKEFYLNEIDNQIRVAEYVNSFEGDVKPLIWISLPCTGGTPWTYINMRIPSAREKILKHIREFDRLWISSKSFLRMLQL